jgi:phytoene dehydrogenase-like protein
VTGVELEDGRTITADVVVSNCDVQRTYRDLDGSQEGIAEQRRIGGDYTPACSGVVLYLGLDRQYDHLLHHDFLFSKDSHEEFDDIFGRRPRPVQDPTIYACVPDDPLMRPDADHESWFVLVNAPRHGDGSDRTFDWSAPGVAEAYADHVLAVLTSRGVDLAGRILWREVRTPADYERDVRAPGGSIYGTSSNGSRAAFQRPANASPISGLYLVGGSAHPGGGLPLVGMSAEIVATLIGRAPADSR